MFLVNQKMILLFNQRYICKNIFDNVSETLINKYNLWVVKKTDLLDIVKMALYIGAILQLEANHWNNYKTSDKYQSFECQYT